MRVLLVDDEAMILRLETTILERAGYEVETAHDGREGLGLAARRPFDVAIVDYDMPSVDGLDVLRELRDLQPNCQRILCSGNLNLPVVMEAVNRGEISRVIQKPVTPHELLETVNDSIAARERANQLRESFRDAMATSSRIAIEECLEGDFIKLALQPIVRAEDASVVAFEALIRSSHAALPSPIEVLRAAEEHGLLARLGKLVAGRAAEWLEQLPPGLQLFLNMHPKELTEPHALTGRLDILDGYASRVVAEITERTYMLDLESWSESVQLLTDRGFEIAVDDLGAGYNSLAVLAELQPAYIKVDMSIVRSVDRDPRKQRLIEMLARFASSTDTLLIAEGIETAEEARALRVCGTHLMQGYYFGRPTLEPDIPSLAV